jgi:hypothetical protein
MGIAAKLEDQFPEIVVANLRCWPAIAQKPGSRKRRLAQGG